MYRWLMIMMLALGPSGCSGVGGVPGARDVPGDAAPDEDLNRDVPARPDVSLPPAFDITGVWFDCIGRIELDGDGTFLYRGLDEGCETSGTWTFEATVLGLEALETTCPTQPTDRQAEFLLDGMVVAATGDRMIWSHPVLDNQAKIWFRADGIAPERWRVRDPDLDREQDLRLCFDTEGLLVQGYYFTPAGKDGLLSGSGRIEEIVEEPDAPGSFQVRATCRGQCLCVALLLVTIDDGTLEGNYTGANCLESFGPGTLAGTVEDWTGYL